MLLESHCKVWDQRGAGEENPGRSWDVGGGLETPALPWFAVSCPAAQGKCEMGKRKLREVNSSSFPAAQSGVRL